MLCEGPVVTATVPGDGQVDVPVDIQPALVVAVDPDCGAEELTVELLEGTGEVRLGQWVLQVSADTPVVRFAPPAPLQPGAPYRVRVTPASGVVTETGFTTGRGAVLLLEGTPEAEVVDETAAWSADAGATTARLRITPAADPVGCSLVTVANEFRINVPLWAGPAGDADEVEVRWEGSHPKAQCYTVTQWDGRGEGVGVDLPCVPVTGAGCAAAGGPPALLPVALGALLARRRRRDRGEGVGLGRAGR